MRPVEWQGGPDARQGGGSWPCWRTAGCSRCSGRMRGSSSTRRGFDGREPERRHRVRGGLPAGRSHAQRRHTSRRGSHLRWPAARAISRWRMNSLRPRGSRSASRCQHNTDGASCRRCRQAGQVQFRCPHLERRPGREAAWQRGTRVVASSNPPGARFVATLGLSAGLTALPHLVRPRRAQRRITLWRFTTHRQHGDSRAQGYPPPLLYCTLPGLRPPAAEGRWREPSGFHAVHWRWPALPCKGQPEFDDSAPIPFAINDLPLARFGGFEEER